MLRRVRVLSSSIIDVELSRIVCLMTLRVLLYWQVWLLFSMCIIRVFADNPGYTIIIPDLVLSLNVKPLKSHVNCHVLAKSIELPTFHSWRKVC